MYDVARDAPCPRCFPDRRDHSPPGLRSPRRHAAGDRAGGPDADRSRSQPPSPAGTVGPLGDDCYSTAGAVACPPDPTDPSGRKLPAYGGACSLPVCHPCGSAKKLAFRDEHGVAMAGFCICVPKSDDSGRGVFTCYATEAWKKRAHCVRARGSVLAAAVLAAVAGCHASVPTKGPVAVDSDRDGGRADEPEVPPLTDRITTASRTGTTTARRRPRTRMGSRTTTAAPSSTTITIASWTRTTCARTNPRPTTAWTTTTAAP